MVTCICTYKPFLAVACFLCFPFRLYPDVRTYSHAHAHVHLAAACVTAFTHARAWRCVSVCLSVPWDVRLYLCTSHARIHPCSRAGMHPYIVVHACYVRMYACMLS